MTPLHLRKRVARRVRASLRTIGHAILEGLDQRQGAPVTTEEWGEDAEQYYAFDDGGWLGDMALEHERYDAKTRAEEKLNDAAALLSRLEAFDD